MERADGNSAKHERELEPNGFAVSLTPSTNVPQELWYCPDSNLWFTVVL